MNILQLNFEGYFQMRMATDPDPTDELRGVSGYTFALAGEPDLDAKVHLQPDEPGVWQRSFGVDTLGQTPSRPAPLPVPLPGQSNAECPRVGVTVRSATIGNTSRDDLVGAKIAFLGAQILEHNGILIRNDYFFIDPLRVRVYHEADQPIVERNDWVNPADPNMPLWEATSPMLVRRQPTTMQSNSPMVAAATGLPNASNQTLIDNRLRRRDQLVALLAVTEDPTERAALETRIEQLAIVEQWWNLSVGTFENRPIDRRAHQLTLLFDGWNISVQGQVFADHLGADPTQPWPLAFWMGGWDGDALTGYVSGTWQIPLR
jgi:hypothetical protein